MNVKLPLVATSITWNNDNSMVYTGGIDGIIRGIDLNTNKIIEIGKHDKGISSLHYLPEKNLLISTAY